MDKNLLAADLSSLPEADKDKISAVVEQLQTRDSLRMYNALAERCFNDCVDSFYRKSLVLRRVGKREDLRGVGQERRVTKERADCWEAVAVGSVTGCFRVYSEEKKLASKKIKATKKPATPDHDKNI
ncbi:Mitochondrial import inner membrane translocase subunit Tim9 [Sesamum alatum]|uniref:Mitochondrial import inner membrane translocase subunit n=1 Tax=Sesamum alatum TaxID=300844 RepID=A0AAE1Z315_9LAMI|nr:Mitochondrial import inner membrane translocase subunit Tim9 [Sesamum alatum]